MERVDEVKVPYVCRCGLIGNIHRVFEWHIPYREGLEFCVSRFNPPFIVIVEMGQAGGQLTASRSRPRDDNEGFFRLDVRIGPVAFIAYNGVDVCGVSLREGVREYRYPPPFKLVFEEYGRRLIFKAGYDNPEDIQSPAPQIVDQLHGI